MDVDIPEIDPNFEPQARGRSNTWPLRPRELTKEEETGTTQSPKSTEGEPGVDTPPRGDPLGLASKKTSSRRNAWGNLSYADLITKAIDSSPEKRLTLSQIYDWMVQNVPYFKDKGDSNSSAGWKNSIRHNLSLHSRFMRVQNEGTGKSSWWVLNPDAKPGKTPRRRATSMDTKAYEKKRGRVKKKVDALRAAAEGHSNPGSEFGDSASELNLPDTFSLSPQDFRARTSSNASSIGRLSPIQSALEPDLHDKQVPPISPIPWQQGSLNASPYSGQDGFTETLSESLAEMFVGDMNNLSSDPSTNDGGMSMNSSTSLSMSNSSPLQPQLSPNNNFQGTDGFLPAPPPYQDSRRRSPQGGQGQQQQLSPNNLTQLGQQSGMGQGVMNVRQNMSLGPANMGQGNNMCENVMNQQTTMDTGVMSTLGAMLESPVTVNNSHQSISSGNMSSMSMRNGLNHGGQQGPAQPGQPRFMAQTLSELLASDNDAMMADSTPRTFSSGGGAFQQQQQQQQSSPIASNSQLSRQQQILGMSSSLLRQALTKKQALQARLAQQQQQQHQQQQLQQMQQLSQLHGITNHHLTQLAMTHGGNHMSLGANSGQGHGGGLGGLPRLPSDLELMNYDMKPAELDCDVNEIIKHELSFDDTLDFNFSEPPPPQDMTGSTSGVDQFNNPLQT